MKRKRRYNLNENYFEVIDSCEKAYWLGFIAADGYITRRKTGQAVLGISLAEIEPLERFREDISTDKPIYRYDWKDNPGKYSDGTEFKLLLVSDKLVNDIEKHGIVERKTFKLKFPKDLKEEYYSHYIRGYFDGDGSVFYTSSRGKKDEVLCVTICGTNSFLTDLSEKIGVSSDKIYKDNRTKNDCWSLKLYNQTFALPFYSYIYKNINGEYFLHRKKKKFDDYIDMKVQRLQSAILEYERIKV